MRVTGSACLCVCVSLCRYVRVCCAHARALSKWDTTHVGHNTCGTLFIAGPRGSVCRTPLVSSNGVMVPARCLLPHESEEVTAHLCYCYLPISMCGCILIYLYACVAVFLQYLAISMCIYSPFVSSICTQTCIHTSCIHTNLDARVHSCIHACMQRAVSSTNLRR